jgi:hypothetical protein
MTETGIRQRSTPERNFKFMILESSAPAENESAYVWDLATDEIEWDARARAVLKVADLSQIATGRAYAMIHDTDAVQDQIESMRQHDNMDSGQGIRYHTKYRLYPLVGSPRCLFVEDIGSWHRDHRNFPILARGVVRVLREAQY